MKDFTQVPFNKPFIVGKELYNIAQAVIKNGHLSGDGKFTRSCQNWIEKTLLCNKAMLTHSCTAALEMAAILSDIKPGDEIIMPSFTFVSTANAFVLRGGVPVFVDIREDTLNINEKLIEEAVTKKTKAIVPVHYAGVPASMADIINIAKHYKVFVIEDAAQALMGTYKGKYLGTIGDLGTLSFHETKNVISGEGGALLVNNENLLERSEIIWQKGTNRKKFIEGKTDKYTWVDIGSSYLPSELVSAFLYAQIEHTEKINAQRYRLVKKYYSMLQPLEQKNYIKLPCFSKKYESNGHLFYILTKSAEERFKLIQFLDKQNIMAVFHYIPLHSSPAGKKFGRPVGDLKVTDSISQRLLRLPLYYEMNPEEVERVVSSIYKFYGESP